MNLQGRTVLITGARGGLGTFVTQAFLQAGASVIGVSRSVSDADFDHESFRAIPAGLASLEDARGVINKAGRVDVLVHLVGGFAGGKSAMETDDQVFDRMVDLNFRSAFHMLRAVLPGMRAQRGGRILAVGSKAAVEPSPSSAIYAASKAALVSFIRSVAAENKDRGITANAVLPGTMDTPTNRAASPDADFSKWVSPCQVASMLVYLASDAASHVNGAVVPILAGDI